MEGTTMAYGGGPLVVVVEQRPEYGMEPVQLQRAYTYLQSVLSAARPSQVDVYGTRMRFGEHHQWIR